MPSSFLEDYRTYVKGTEAHPTYHLYSSLIALSTIISRRVWVEMGYFQVYPNLYVILVGPAGNRKTSAMTPAKNLVRTLGLPFSAECVTKEKLVLDMAEQEVACAALMKTHPKQATYTPMACIVTELSQFFGAGGPAMSDFLTTIYDQDVYELRTKNKGSTTIAGPYLNLLACTTPDWITMYLRQDVISGGFSRRALFVYEVENAGKVAFPEITPEAAAAWERLILRGRELLKVSGKFEWEPAAKSWYINWYQNFRAPVDPVTTGYYQSKHIQLIKIAMLRALSDSNELLLRQEHLESAMAILSIYERNLAKVFMGIGRNELNGVAQKVLTTIETAPTLEITEGARRFSVNGLPEKRLFAAHFNDGTQQEITQCVQHLISSGKVARFTQTINGTAIAFITTAP